MTMGRPIALMAASLPVLALGLAAQFFDPHATVSHVAQAQAVLWQRLGAQHLARPNWALPAEMIFLSVAGAVMIFLMLRPRLHWAGVFLLGALVCGFYGALALARLKGLALDVLVPGGILLLAFAAGALVRWRQLSATKRQLRFAFSDSLPRAALEKIAHDPDLLPMDGETRTVTYLACGVRGLGELASAFKDRPKAFTQVMELVLTPLMGQILRHGGVIGQLTADGFAAYWNAPLEDPRHALHACDAAWGMITALAKVNGDLASAGRPGGPRPPMVEIGIGIATGPVVAGGFGGQGRASYALNGDAVRLAARLQALSRNYGPAVLVSEETRQGAAEGFAFLEVDYIAQGRDDSPVRLYAMLENPLSRASPKIRALVTFHEHIFQSLRSQQWAQARILIGQCRNLSGAYQTLYDLYTARIRYFESNPPGADWDGAFRPVLK